MENFFILIRITFEGIERFWLGLWHLTQFINLQILMKFEKYRVISFDANPKKKKITLKKKWFGEFFQDHFLKISIFLR